MLVRTAIVFTVASFGTASPVLTAAFAAGSLAAGVAQAAYDVDDYRTERDANQAGLLADKPSAIWAAISVAAVGVEALQFNHAVRLLTFVDEGSMSIRALPNGLMDKGVSPSEAHLLTELAAARAAQRSATRAAEAATDAPAKLSLRWRGQNHELFAWHNPDLGRVGIGMCSDRCGPLLDKLDAWIAVSDSEEATRLLRSARDEIQQIADDLVDPSIAHDELAEAKRVLGELETKLEAKGLGDYFDPDGVPADAFEILRPRLSVGAREVLDEMIDDVGKDEAAKTLLSGKGGDPARRLEGQAKKRADIAAGGPAAREAAAAARVRQAHKALTESGFFQQWDVKGAIAEGRRDNLRGMIGEALVELQLRAEFPGHQILTGIRVAERVPGASTIAEAVARNFESSNLRLIDGVVYDSISEIDTIVIDADNIPILLGEVKAASTTAGAARRELEKKVGNLLRAAAEPENFKLLDQQRNPIAQQLNLTAIESTQTRVTGLRPGFDERIQTSAGDIVTDADIRELTRLILETPG